MTWLVPILAAGVLGAVILRAKTAKATEMSAGKSGSFHDALMRATIPGQVMDAAKKWARQREIPISDVLATILLESRGNPKAHAKTAKEDSRGAMQVNVNAHGPLLASLKYSPDDLFDPDKGIEVGTLILKRTRDNVKGWLARTRVAPAHSLDTYMRLAYAGPAYVQKALVNATKTEDTVRPFKNAETYISHWKDAKMVVAQRWGAMS